MKFRFVLAAVAAFAMLFGLVTNTTSAAFAKDNGKGRTVWMSGGSGEEILTRLQTGETVCVGNKKPLGTCMSLNGYLGEVTIQTISRPPGLNKNVTIITIAAVSPTGTIVRNDAGVILARFQVGSEQQNAAAIWTTAIANILPAAMNGIGAAGIQAAFPACGRGGCGGGGSVAYAISGSEANAVLQGAFGGGCSTGTCATPAPAPKPH